MKKQQMMVPRNQRVQSLADAAKRAKCSPRTLQARCRNGEIKGAVLVSGNWVLPMSYAHKRGKVGRPPKQ